MTDVEYPQWLVDEVADVISDTAAKSEINARMFEECAAAVLEHLGFERRDGWGNVPPGSQLLHYGVPGKPANHYERWIGGTEWHQANEEVEGER